MRFAYSYVPYINVCECVRMRWLRFVCENDAANSQKRDRDELSAPLWYCPIYVHLPILTQLINHLFLFLNIGTEEEKHDACMFKKKSFEILFIRVNRCDYNSILGFVSQRYRLRTI